MKTRIGLGSPDDATPDDGPPPRVRPHLNVQEFQLRPPAAKIDHQADALHAWDVVEAETRWRSAAETEARRYKHFALVGLVSTVLSSVAAILGWARALTISPPPSPPPRARADRVAPRK